MALATKTDDLNLVPGTQMVGENTDSMSCLWPAQAWLMLSTYMYIRTHNQIQEFKRFLLKERKQQRKHLIACRDSLKNGRNTLAKSAHERGDIYKKF